MGSTTALCHRAQRYLGVSAALLSKLFRPTVSGRILIRRNSYKVLRDLNICLLETRTSDSFSNKHGFGLCANSAPKPTLSLVPAQREGVASSPLSLPQPERENEWGECACNKTKN